jgi:hypothetical protein
MEMGADDSGRHRHLFTRLLRDSVSTEVLQGLCGGGTLRQSSGSAYTAPNDNIFDCNKGLND